MELEEQVLARLKPGPEDDVHIQQTIEKLIETVMSSEAASKCEFEPYLVGSIAKNTHLKDPDADLFLLFHPDIPREELEKHGLAIGKESIIGREHYAEHPYIKGVYLKGGRHQDIIIMYTEIVKPLLNWYMQYKSTQIPNYDKVEHVFVSQRGNTTESYIYTLIRKCSHILGRNLSPRMFRKGLGVHTKELGLQDEVRRMIMAHKDVKTTIDAYSDYTIKDIARELSMKIPSHDRNSMSQSGSQVQSIQSEKCPFCGGPVESEMLLCPHCWETIKVVCESCKRFIQITWKKCPYCGAEMKDKEKFEYAL